MWNSFVLIKGEKEGRKEVFAEKVLLLFRCSLKRESARKELAIVRYIECVALLDEKDEGLECVCVCNGRLRALENWGMTWREGEGKKLMPAGEWSGVTLYQRTVSTVYVVRANFAGQPSTTELS